MEYYIGIIITLFLTLLGWIMVEVRRLSNRVEDLEKSTLHKDEIKERIDDKLEALKVEIKDQKEDIAEIKNLLRSLCNGV